MEILTNTPLWVWGVLLLLIYIGWQQQNDREVSGRAIVMLPFAMLIFSLFGIISAFGVSVNALGMWFLGYAIATLLAQKFIPLSVALSESGKLRVQGSNLPLVLMLCIFVLKYILGAMPHVNPELLHVNIFVMVMAVLLGTCSGVFLGRVLPLFKS